MPLGAGAVLALSPPTYESQKIVDAEELKGRVNPHPTFFLVFRITQGCGWRGCRDEKKTSLICHRRMKLLNFLSLERLCRKDENSTFVILNKVKNLMHSIRYTTQILRLTP